MEQPPKDAEDWTEERWLDWLNKPENQAVEEPDQPVQHRRRGGEVLGAAMMGLEQALYGRVTKPEVVIEVDADGKDDGLRLGDDGSLSTIINVPSPTQTDDDR